jgi:MoaA/NifB/PqqE/SkfB family radical SAM enzyme
MILYNRGEPFLHKDILSMIRYAHERRLATVISSNLTILPDGGGEAVVQSGLDDLVVSCDGLTQKPMRRIEEGAIWKECFQISGK